MLEAKDNSNFDKLMFFSQGHVAFQCLIAGLDLGLFDSLEAKSMTREEIMNSLSIEETPCKILLRALYTMNLIERTGEKYCNSQIASQYLTSSSQVNFRDVLGWQNDIVYPAITDFTDSIKTNSNKGLRFFEGEGNNLYQRLGSHPDLLKTFQKAMSALSKTANQQFIEQLDLSKSNVVVDVGGGDGTNLKLILERFPHLKGIVFDLETVCEIADKNIQDWGLESKLKTHPGNLFDDNFPESADVILFCHMFTIWSGEKITKILKKCYEALPKGGKVVVFNMFSNDDENGPVSCALGSPYFLSIATGEGGLHTTAEYKAWFEDAGFSGFNYFGGLPVDHGYIIAEK